MEKVYGPGEHKYNGLSIKEASIEQEASTGVGSSSRRTRRSGVPGTTRPGTRYWLASRSRSTESRRRAGKRRGSSFRPPRKRTFGRGALSFGILQRVRDAATRQRPEQCFACFRFGVNGLPQGTHTGPLRSPRRVEDPQLGKPVRPSRATREATVSY